MCIRDRLSTQSASTYQWLCNGLPLAGATAQTYTALQSGTYAVTATDIYGCTGTSPGHAVTISFCAQSEVSPQQAAYPARVVKDSASPTGFYAYFQKIEGALGFNVYEGTIGVWYSHASAAGNACNPSTTDLGTGEMRAEITPTLGDHYYLVTAFDATVEGPSGFGSSGGEIPAAQSTCGP